MPIEMVIEHVLSSVIFGVVVLGVAFSPIGKAMGHRIMHGKPPKQVPVSDDPRVDDLSGEVAALRDQLDAALDRLDFTERLLAQVKERGQVGPGNGR